jgi:hypothetical protein
MREEDQEAMGAVFDAMGDAVERGLPRKVRSAVVRQEEAGNECLPYRVAAKDLY